MDKKISELPTTEVNGSDYIPVANTTSGTRKVLMEDVLDAANPTIDSELSDTSENAVQNKVVAAALGGKADTVDLTELSEAVEGKADSDDVAALSEDVEDVKSALDVAVKSVVSDKVTQTTFARESMTAGIMAKNGAITSSTAAGYTPPFDVEPGEVITAERYYLNSQGAITGKESVNMRAGAFRANEEAAYTNVGFSTATSSYTVPDGMYSAQITISGVMTGTYTNVLITRTLPNGQTIYVLQDAISGIVDNSNIAALAEGNLSMKNLDNKFACALPTTVFRMTVGLPEKWYKKSMVTPPTEFVFVSGGYSLTDHSDDGAYFANESAISSANSYVWSYYDPLMVKVDEYLGSAGIGGARRVLAENLSDCSLLALGDSTVDQDAMTAKLLSYFSEKNKTITLLGTLGSSTEPLNRNEGRSGWSTGDYLANTTKNGYTNPFWNPTTEAFDFSYYMANQGYTGVDFVVLQLGINDLYPSSTFAEPESNDTIWGNMKTMIDSILDYSSSIKILLNLPTTPNSNANMHRIPEFLYRNNVVSYNAYAIAHAKAEYAESSVRVSYCHLILDPATDILDNVHPTSDGYEKMALEIVNQINVWQNGY